MLLLSKNEQKLNDKTSSFYSTEQNRFFLNLITFNSDSAFTNTMLTLYLDTLHLNARIRKYAMR